MDPFLIFIITILQPDHSTLSMSGLTKSGDEPKARLGKPFLRFQQGTPLGYIQGTPRRIQSVGFTRQPYQNSSRVWPYERSQAAGARPKKASDRLRHVLRLTYLGVVIGKG